MGERREARDRRLARDFDTFVTGAGGRLLHVAALLTAEPAECCPAARRLLTAALARTYASWPGLHGEDPYDRARQELVALFAHTAWRYRRARGGPLGRLTPLERLVVVLRLHEGVAEEQAAAVLGLPPDRVRAVCARAVTALRRPAPATPAGAGATGAAAGAGSTGAAAGALGEPPLAEVPR
ncbi:sigma factor-like helix-turn-helix DNA-binding protein [Streptomyces sp. 549]|uniref:sigma factor-like helix-turn-helix DNA-binding protein n=1 Tax=Streptomyces sp. 549 TaxID=3049076 RepID=UPI0024C37B53|nr:sigma factor-like helix-turn-helix DNA-binding protein [Streptomyces sp. 549]MDK1472652.1 sigma factor-like helix-turn-helix DNA-binding protein [Streptomyces sp. 549]